jgi:drug/metabolite transporter (DMT)-like permease
MKEGQVPLERALGPAAAAPAFLLLRFLLAALLFPAIFPSALRGLTRETLGAGILLSVPFCAGFYLQVKGLQDTTATVSAFLTNLTVVLTPVLGRLFFHERLRWSTAGGAVTATIGVYVLTNPAGGTFGPGEVLTTASAVAWALQIQLTNLVTRKHRPESITWIMFCSATLCWGAVLVAMGTDWPALARTAALPRVAGSVAFTGTLCSIAAITVMNRYQKDLPPTRAAVIYTIEPVFAALFASWGGESMTLRKLCGGAIIIAGNLLCELWQRDSPASEGDAAVGNP